MKKILFSLVALVCSMSMNAQVMKVMKGNVVVATYTANQADNVVFEEAQVSTTTGTAAATGIGNVGWVQLWTDGPKFAEFNVGVTDGKAESYGGYYAWGGSQDKVDDHNTGTVDLTGDADTATKLWGSAWRMPTQSELNALLANCDVEWTAVNGVNGRKFTGKGDYASNSVFLPAAGDCPDGNVRGQGIYGFYLSSTPDGSTHAYYLYFDSGFRGDVGLGDRGYGRSVRAVALVCSMSMNAQVMKVMKVMKGNVVVATYTADRADNVVFEEAQGSTTTGTAAATGIGNVGWVQLWTDGPKFAEFNVGVTDGKAESYGGYYAWGGSQDKVDDHNTGTVDLTGDADTATKLWGSAWRMPTRSELNALLANCDVEWTAVNGVNGRKFTGKGDYASNSVFLPAAGDCTFMIGVYGQGSHGCYWSSSTLVVLDDDGACPLYFDSSRQHVDTNFRNCGYSVRAVLAE